MKYKIQCIGNRNTTLRFYINTDLSNYCITEKICSEDEISSDADICLAWGIYTKIRTENLYKPRLGVWGFHETKLPEGKRVLICPQVLLSKDIV